jgi:hypothetical protein
MPCGYEFKYSTAGVLYLYRGTFYGSTTRYRVLGYCLLLQYDNCRPPGAPVITFCDSMTVR